MKISPKQLLTLLNIARDAAMTKLIEEVENQQSDEVVDVSDK